MNAVSDSFVDGTPRQVLDALTSGMGLSEEELIEVLGASRRTVRRWRSGATYPAQAGRHRLTELLSLYERVQRTFEGEDAPRQWLHSPSRYLHGLTPFEAIREGNIEEVEAALEAFDSGIFL